MDDASALLKYVCQALERLMIPYAITGSWASITYGEPRVTYDIDIVIRMSPAQLPSLLSAFADDSFYVSADAARAAVASETQFNVIHSDSGIKIDFYPRRTGAYVDSQLRRALRVPRKDGYDVMLISPEDSVVSKMRFYKEGASERQLRDVAGIVRKQGDQLDHAYIERWAREFDLMEIWTAILERLRHP